MCYQQLLFVCSEPILTHAIICMYISKIITFIDPSLFRVLSIGSNWCRGGGGGGEIVSVSYMYRLSFRIMIRGGNSKV